MRQTYRQEEEESGQTDRQAIRQQQEPRRRLVNPLDGGSLSDDGRGEHLKTTNGQTQRHNKAKTTSSCHIQPLATGG